MQCVNDGNDRSSDDDDDDDDNGDRGTGAGVAVDDDDLQCCSFITFFTRFVVLLVN